jgi:hypothetical protein
VSTHVPRPRKASAGSTTLGAGVVRAADEGAARIVVDGCTDDDATVVVGAGPDRAGVAALDRLDRTLPGTALDVPGPGRDPDDWHPARPTSRATATETNVWAEVTSS